LVSIFYIIEIAIMKTNNPKTTSSDPHVDQFLTAVGRLSLVHLIKLDPTMVRDISNQAGLPDAQSSGQSASSSQCAEQDNLIDPVCPVRAISLEVPFPENLRLIWTRSKIDLVELIYALRELGAFNHGKAELKAITRCFEYMFSFELGNISSSFQEILERKKSYTNITDKLRDVFLKKVENSGRG
jgi:RteC protein